MRPTVAEVQGRLDEMYPRGACVIFVVDQDAPENLGNPQYHVARMLVDKVYEDGTYRLALDPAYVEGKFWNLHIIDEEQYGEYEDLTSVLFTTVDDDVLWITSHITDVMDRALREYEANQPWFKEITRHEASSI